MRQFEEFLDANTGRGEHLDDRLGPEGVVLFEGEVVATPGGGVVGPDLVGAGVRGVRADQGLSGRGECLAGSGLAGSGQQFRGFPATSIDAGAQRGQDRQPFAGTRVHAGFALPLGFSPIDLFLADRAGCHPPRPAGRVFDRPVRQVEIERAHRRQRLAVADPRGIDDGLLPGRGSDGDRLRAQPLFPGVGDVGGQVQAVDAGMMLLEVGPEPFAEVERQRFETGVVQGGLAFTQVVHEQVAHRSTGETIAVDQFLRCALPVGGAQLVQGCRGGVVEDAGSAEDSVERAGAAAAFGVDVALGVEQFEDVADGDVGDRAAFAGQDDGAAVQDRLLDRRGDVGVGVAQLPQSGEALGGRGRST